MRPLASRLDQISASPTLALDSKAKAMQQAGQDVINYGIGEPDFETPDYIKEAAVKAIRDGFTKYTAADGIPELKEAVCEKFKRDNGLLYNPAQIAVSNGGKHSLYNIFMTLFQPGDEVIVPAPYWVSYTAMLILAGATPVVVQTNVEDNYNLTAEALEAAITPKTKGLLINSPTNPTGAVYSRESLKNLSELALKHNLWVISDDIYEKLIYNGTEFVNIAIAEPALYDQTIIVHGLSKTYAMTGWRIGFMAGPEKVARGVAKLQSQTTSNPSSISQKAAVAALTGPQDQIKSMADAFKKRRDLVVEMLNDIPGISCLKPQGAFYAFPDVKSFFGRSDGTVTIKGSDDLADWLLEKAQVAVVPGSGFGDDRCLRLSYALNDEDIKRGLVRMKEALSSLK